MFAFKFRKYFLNILFHEKYIKLIFLGVFNMMMLKIKKSKNNIFEALLIKKCQKIISPNNLNCLVRSQNIIYIIL